MAKAIRSRIVEHTRIKAGDLVPHELNPRTHSDTQRQALQALWDRIGFARSLLAYRLPDGRLKLIDGHLRASMDPTAEVDVEVLDVNDEEARQLLLSIDPLAALAGFDNDILDQLRGQTQTDSDTLHNLWQSLGQAEALTEQTLASTKAKAKKPDQHVPEQFMILVECSNEQEQIKLLRKFKREGLKCAAKTV